MKAFMSVSMYNLQKFEGIIISMALSMKVTSLAGRGEKDSPSIFSS
jgi:hypothetical protein